MKKLMTVLLSFVLLGSVCLLNPVFAEEKSVNINQSSSNAEFINDTLVNEKDLSGGIKRKEVVTCLKRSYKGGLSDIPYKYLTVRVDVTYFDSKGKSFASAYLESYFRYSSEFHESKCLSTCHGQSCMNPKYSLGVFARTKNLAYEIGESYGTIKLLYKSMCSDELSYVFSCDYDGNIFRYNL